jgi:hypothetical protein
MHARKQLKNAAVLRILAIVGALVLFASASKNAPWSCFAILNSKSRVSSEVSSGRTQRGDAILRRDNASPRDNGSHSVEPSAIKNAYGVVPLSFEVNQGQTDPSVQFLSRGANSTLFLTKKEIVMQLQRKNPGRRLSSSRQTTDDIQSLPIDLGFPAMLPGPFFPHSATSPYDRLQTEDAEVTLRMMFAGANSDPDIEGLERVPGISNYFIGNDPRKWHTNIPHYARVRYREIYPGIDVVYKGIRDHIEYDLVVSPGADPRLIKLSPEGVDRVYLTEAGDLVLIKNGLQICQQKPVIYQETEGVRHEIEGRFRVDGQDVGFEVASSYAKNLELTIDPVFLYTTPIPGHFEALALDPNGNAYITGGVGSGLPTTQGAFQTALHGLGDAFIVKLDATGTMEYVTYLGGNDGEYGPDIAVDASGNAYVTGLTLSDDFPTTTGAFQKSKSSVNSAFVSKLNDSGSMLLYSTYLGPTAGSKYPVTIDASGSAYVTGQLGLDSMQNFPITAGAMQTMPSGAFVTKLNPTGSALTYSTYFGGSASTSPQGITVDSAGNAYVCGSAQENLPTTPGAFQGLKAAGVGPVGDGSDGFIAKLNPTGTQMVFATYLGGNGTEGVLDIAVDSTRSVYVTGSTSYTTNFPTTAGAYHTENDISDFVAKLNPTGSALMYSTLAVGGMAIKVDSAGNVFTVGGSSGDGIQSVSLAKLNASGSALLYSSNLMNPYSTYFPADVAIDAAGNAFVAVNQGAVLPQPPHGALYMVWVGASAYKISDSVAPYFVPIVLSLGGLNNSYYTSELTLTNSGSQESTIHFDYTAAYGGGSGTASDFLSAGQQRIIPDAIAYLRRLGIPIPDFAGQGGTLRVGFTELSSGSSTAVTVRTTTAEPAGRAGLAHSGILIGGMSATPVPFTGTSYLCGLRQNATDRSNVAIQNVGSPADGDIVLRLTVISGDPTVPSSFTLADETLPPGGFKQFNSILTSKSPSLTNAYVRVERISGTAPYYAYAVINDQGDSDGSFVAPTPDSEMTGGNWVALPVMVATNLFSSELVITNWASTPATLQCEYVADNIQSSDSKAQFTLDIAAQQQRIIPNFVQFLRDSGIPGLSDTALNYVGPLLVTVQGEKTSKVFLGARTSALGKTGRYGVFYPQVAYRDDGLFPPPPPVTVYGLQQNAETRSNLAIVNLGNIIFAYLPLSIWADGSTDYFTIEILDGETGKKVATIDDFAVKPKQWRQIDRILEQYAPNTRQGYVRITRKQGSNPFFAYGVLNDGGHPGERTGDGAFIASSP